MAFKDHFSAIATDYAAYRPQYPDELYAHIASLCPIRDRAVDCGTGNGQAAIGLARHFREVIATDPSRAQLAAAAPHDRVRYHEASAAALPVEDASADLVSAAAAAHWFPHDAFHAEVRRVLKPGGLVALWTYWKADVDPVVNAVIERFQFTLVGPYWPPERALVNSAYRDLPFPFNEQRSPSIVLRVEWDLDHFIGYLGTWSAVQRYKEVVGADPVDHVRADLRAAWGPGLREVRWPLAMRIGTV